LLYGLSAPFVCQVAVSVVPALLAEVKNGTILGRAYFGRALPLFAGLAAYWWVTTVTTPWLSLFGLPLVSFAITVFAQAAVSRPVVERYVVAPLRRKLVP